MTAPPGMGNQTGLGGGQFVGNLGGNLRVGRRYGFVRVAPDGAAPCVVSVEIGQGVPILTPPGKKAEVRRAAGGRKRGEFWSATRLAADPPGPRHRANKTPPANRGRRATGPVTSGSRRRRRA